MDDKGVHVVQDVDEEEEVKESSDGVVDNEEEGEEEEDKYELLDDVEDDEEDDPDEDKEDDEVDPPRGHIRLRPSKFKMIPSTVFVEYPKVLEMTRSDNSELQLIEEQELGYRCKWGRNCIRNAFTRAGFKDSPHNWTAMWAAHQAHFKLRELNCLQKVNHFPGSWALGRKDRLSRTMWAMKRLYPTEYSFHPESYVLPGENSSLERSAKADVFYNRTTTSKCKRYWIIKPVASSCGRGIRVISADKAYAISKNNERKMLVQRYLGDPYLIEGKKFDMRLYVLVTGVDPLRIYLHEEGLIRIATEKYTTKSLKNQYVHLTNYSINKNSKCFHASTKFNFDEKSENSLSDGSPQGRDGFKWTLKAFKSWLTEKESASTMENTMERVHGLIVKTILAAEPDLSHSLHATVNYRTNCFELFGFDVLLDSQLNPHLIEVNVSPSLAGTSPLDNYIKGVLVADVCHVTGFHAHDEVLLEKYQSHRSTTLTEEVDDINPFSFASLSKLMAGQDEWRKDMRMRNINMSKIGNADAAWYMLLMAEDEFDRAEKSKFQKLHPSVESIDRYIALYKNARFSDQLLGRWVLGGMSQGKLNRTIIPKRFKKFSLPDDDDKAATSSPRGTGVALARSRGKLSLLPSPTRASSADSRTPSINVDKSPTNTGKQPHKDRYMNLKNNLKQQSGFLYDPIERKKNVYLPNKMNRKKHSSIVFEPISKGNYEDYGGQMNAFEDMYLNLMKRNMKAGLKNSSLGSGVDGKSMLMRSKSCRLDSLEIRIEK